jgi:hypothetical protein
VAFLTLLHIQTRSLTLFVRTLKVSMASNGPNDLDRGLFISLDIGPYI